MIPPPPSCTLFPYTTLFRSVRYQNRQVDAARNPGKYRNIPKPMGDAQIVYGDKVINNRNWPVWPRSEEHTSELQSHSDLVCRLLLEKKRSRRARADHPQLGR